MQTMIEIDGSLIPEGWEAVRVGLVKHQEHYVGGDGVCRWEYTKPSYGPVLIVRPVWQWPDWIKPGKWLAQHRTGSWWLFDHEPASLMGHDDWNRDGWVIPSRCVDFTPPPCTDWRESKRQKPEE